jgi:threonine dehydrogenase-like Zn-dependent dehydrogenase
MFAVKPASSSAGSGLGAMPSGLPFPSAASCRCRTTCRTGSPPSCFVLARIGFGPIHVVEPASYRAAFATSLGAVETTAQQAAAGRFRLVVEATGKDAARQTALEAVGPEGAILQLGESDAWAIAETRSIRLKDFFLVRSFYFPIGSYSANLELLRADRAKYERLVDATADLDGLGHLFQSFAQGKNLKPLMLPI